MKFIKLPKWELTISLVADDARLAMLPFPVDCLSRIDEAGLLPRPELPVSVRATLVLELVARIIGGRPDRVVTGDKLSGGELIVCAVCGRLVDGESASNGLSSLFSGSLPGPALIV